MATLLDETTFSELMATDSPTLSNAIEELGIRDHREGFTGSHVRCMFPELGITMGYAVTAQIDTTGPGPVDVGRGMREFTDLMAAAPKPVVVVVQDIGPHKGRAAMFGDYAATVYGALGAIAFVTDGAIRDLSPLRRMNFACFAAGTSVSHGNPRRVTMDIPIEIDGMVVEPGDLIHGDENGLLNVPINAVRDLPAQIEQVRATEKAAMDLARNSDTSIDEALRRMGH
jgi:regulator of RNase E activity RraA